MTTKIHSKIEEIPTIADFVLASVTRDLADFTAYSPIFTEAYLTDFEAKRKIATELIMTDSVNYELKATTAELYKQLKNFRSLLVRIEGYLHLATSNLNNEKLGLVKLRLNINKGNIEGVILNGRSFLTNLTKNKTVLMEKGLKQEQLDNITTLLNTVERLNKEQNLLQSKRSENCLKNRDIFNNLWDLLWPVMKAGKAIYKGTNESKLKDYTMTQIQKRMNNERKKAAAEADAPADPAPDPVK